MARKKAPAFQFILTLWLLMAGVAVGAVGMLAWQASGKGSPPMPGDAQGVANTSVKVISVAKRLLDPGRPSRVIYLNREGATLSAGPDDATANFSSIVANSELRSASVPAFAGSHRRWKQISSCVKDKFKDFDVTVVDQRPMDGDYLMAVIGGTPASLGFHTKDKHKHSHSTGLAPFNGENIPNAVVLVFSKSLREALRTTCEATAMEVAHAYGLDHARDCKDIMTYKKPCGPKRFVDKDIPCGEHKDRACEGDKPTQNSFRHLTALLGPKVK